jgi:hypothetical protein
MILTRKQKILFSFILAHLLIILVVCINATIGSYHTTFPLGKRKNLPLQRFRSAVSSILTLPVLSQYTATSGIDAGYGFFAPNVASAYVLKFEIYNQSGKAIHSFYIPPFKSREGLIRYDTFLGAFQDRMITLEEERLDRSIKKKKDLHTRFLDALIKSMSRNLMQIMKVQKSDYMKTTLYLYEYPIMKNFIGGDQNPKFIHLLTYDIKPTDGP